MVTENESNSGWRWLLPISLVADVSAVLTVLSGSASTATLVIGVVALLIGVGLVLAKIGKPVDKLVLLAVVGIVAGTAAVSVVATRALTNGPDLASGPSSPASTGSTAGSSATPTNPTSQQSSAAPQEAPGVRRTSGDKPVQLTPNYGIDLDSSAVDWGAARTGTSDASKHDVYYDGGYLWAGLDLAPVKKDATLEDCVRAGYKRYTKSEEVIPDATFCVKTNGKAFARVRLDKVDQGDLLVLDILVWSPKD